MTENVVGQREAPEIFLLSDPRLAEHSGYDAMFQTAAAGYGFLRTFLGDATQRQALFSAGMHPERVLVALVKGRFAGILGFKLHGSGPMAPSWRDFFRVYGWHAWRAWAAFRLAERFMRSAGVYVCWLHVFPEFRRQGVGSVLMHALSNIALQHGKNSLKLHVRRNNMPANAFYGAMGFVPTEEHSVILRLLSRVTGFDFLCLERKVPAERIVGTA